LPKIFSFSNFKNYLCAILVETENLMSQMNKKYKVGFMSRLSFDDIIFK